MTKRSNNIDTTIIYLEILRSIPKVGFISAKDISQRLAQLGVERDIRSIQRIMTKLCEHFEIECNTENKPYGYRWKSHARGFEVPMMSVQESLMLVLAEHHLKYLLPSNIMESMSPFFQQAQRKLLRDENHQPEYEWLNKVCIVPTSQPLIPAKFDKEIFDTVTEALFENRWLDVEYQNQKGKISQKRVMPLALAQQGPSLYLVVRFEGFEDERHLALHRMKSAKASTFQFIRPKDFQLTQYQSEGRFGFGRGQKIRLYFNISHESGFHLTETPLSPDQEIIQQTEQYYRFAATVFDSEMLDWWLNKFADEVWDIEKIPL